MAGWGLCWAPPLPWVTCTRAPPSASATRGWASRCASLPSGRWQPPPSICARCTMPCLCQMRYALYVPGALCPVCNRCTMPCLCPVHYVMSVPGALCPIFRPETPTCIVSHCIAPSSARDQDLRCQPVSLVKVCASKEHLAAMLLMYVLYSRHCVGSVIQFSVERNVHLPLPCNFQQIRWATP